MYNMSFNAATFPIFKIRTSEGKTEMIKTLYLWCCFLANFFKMISSKNKKKRTKRFVFKNQKRKTGERLVKKSVFCILLIFIFV